MNLIENKDWAAIYDQSTPVLFQNPDVSKNQYILFMSSLAEGVPDAALKDYYKEDMEMGNGVNASGNHAVAVTFRQLKGVKDRQLIYVCHVVNTLNGWQAQPLPLARIFAEVDAKTDDQMWTKLLKAMDRANLLEIRMNLGGAVFVRENLRKYLQGQLDFSKVTHG